MSDGDEPQSEWAPGGEMSRAGSSPPAAAPWSVADASAPPMPEPPDSKRARTPLIVGSTAAVLLVVASTVWRQASDDGAPQTAPTTTDRTMVTSTAPSTSPPATVTSTTEVPFEIVDPGLGSTVVTEPARPAEPTERELGVTLSGSADLRPVLFDADGVVHEVDLGSGVVRSTPVAPVMSGAPAYVFVADDVITIAAYDNVTGFELGPDGSPTIIPAEDQPSGLLFPGPFANSVWQMDRVSSGVSMTLLDLRNEPLGPRVERPDASLVGVDGSGNVLIAGIGGVYATGRSVTKRLTTGELLAVGENHVVARECDENLVCGLVRRDRGTGDTITVAAPELGDAPALTGDFGVIGDGMSPDGRLVLVRRTEGAQSWVMVDLETGAAVEAPAPTAFSSIAWSSDGRFAAYIAAEQLQIFDRDAGRVVIVPDLTRLRAMGT